eukprot:CAMPEP_0202727250 /NCGR_PEP_ID=MMETSP1385-20130828/185027_1 /ASSEMBLY_ACC=CAM_ASM_000861 /TAXON_ID=933848 /ORGANISM="Elphidium margaritaceum" /LENGTH=633 /DNA_ID=CAMNT_0049393489 /DNA_START=91 /DNA_END=1992 /DNA_ORIENTATION=-
MDQRALIQSMLSSHRHRRRDKRSASHKSWSSTSLQQTNVDITAVQSVLLDDMHDMTSTTMHQAPSLDSSTTKHARSKAKKKKRKKVKIGDDRDDCDGKKKKIKTKSSNNKRTKRKKQNRSNHAQTRSLVLNQSLTELELENSVNIAGAFGEELMQPPPHVTDLVDLSCVISDIKTPKKNIFSLKKRKRARNHRNGNGARGGEKSVPVAAAAAAAAVQVVGTTNKKKKSKLRTIKEERHLQDAHVHDRGDRINALRVSRSPKQAHHRNSETLPDLQQNIREKQPSAAGYGSKKTSTHSLSSADFIPQCRLRKEDEVSSQPVFELIPLPSSVSTTSGCDQGCSVIGDDVDVDHVDADVVSDKLYPPKLKCSKTHHKSKKKKKAKKMKTKKTSTSTTLKVQVDVDMKRIQQHPLERYPSNLSAELIEPTPQISHVEQEMEHDAWIKERQKYIAEIKTHHKSKKKKKAKKMKTKKTSTSTSTSTTLKVQVDVDMKGTQQHPLERYPSNLSADLIEPTPQISHVEQEMEHDAWIKERQKYIAEIVRGLLEIKDDEYEALQLNTRTRTRKHCRGDSMRAKRAKTPQHGDGGQKAFVFHGDDCIGDVIELDTDKIFWNIHRSHKLFNVISPSELCKRFAV